MKIILFITGLLHAATFSSTALAQNGNISSSYNRKESVALQKKLCKGWNTWNVHSVLSHVLLPAGFAINLQPVSGQTGDTLIEAFIGNEQFGKKEHIVPGPRTYDGSYTELSVSWQNMRFQIQTAASGKRLYLFIEPLNHAAGDRLLLEPTMLWGRKGEIKLDGNHIEAKTASGEIKLFLTGGKMSVGNHTLTCSFDEPIAISSDPNVSVNEIRQIIADAKSRCLQQRAAFGAVAEEYNAMQSVLAWNTIFDPINNRAITPVSRSWAAPSGGWVLFEWDTYFAASMLALDNKELAYANAIAITNEITDRGIVPNNAQPGLKSEDRSEPPVGSLMVLQIYRQYGEKWFLQEVFDKLLKWNRWWNENRNLKGYLVLGSDPYDYGNAQHRSIQYIGKLKAAKWESGLDNSPMYDDVHFDSSLHRMLQADVGLMSLYIADCKSLAIIAGKLGKNKIARELTERAGSYAKALSGLWDDSFGLYLNKDLVSGKFSYRISPTLFYPLLAGVPTQQQAARMIKEHFYNPAEFWGEFIMPSIARNDPAFKDNKYWRGRIWAPMNYLVYLGLKNYALPDAQQDMVEKSAHLLLQSWNSEHHVYENYNAVTGRGDDAGSWSDPFYHWGALLGFIKMIDKGYMPLPFVK